MAFKIGDVVRHRGIAMTVEGGAYENLGRVLVPCAWFEEGELYHASFEEKALYPARLRSDELAPRFGEGAPPPSSAHTVADAMRKAAADYHARQDAAMRAMPARAPAAPHPWFGPSGVRALAQELYEAYGQQAAWKNFLGREMPVWGELPDHIQESWTAVAQRAIDRVGGER